MIRCRANNVRLVWCTWSAWHMFFIGWLLFQTTNPLHIAMSQTLSISIADEALTHFQMFNVGLDACGMGAHILSLGCLCPPPIDNSHPLHGTASSLAFSIVGCRPNLCTFIQLIYTYVLLIMMKHRHPGDNYNNKWVGISIYVNWYKFLIHW